MHEMAAARTLPFKKTLHKKNLCRSQRTSHCTHGGPTQKRTHRHPPVFFALPPVQTLALRQAGHKTAKVLHNASSHCLQASRLGKLILLKMPPNVDQTKVGSALCLAVFSDTDSGCPLHWFFCPSANYLRQKSRHSSRFFLFQRHVYRPMAAIAVRAICASSLDLTPLTPTAPRHCPSFMIGTPPSSMPWMAGADKNEVRPPLMTSS